MDDIRGDGCRRIEASGAVLARPTYGRCGPRLALGDAARGHRATVSPRTLQAYLVMQRELDIRQVLPDPGADVAHRRDGGVLADRVRALGGRADPAGPAGRMPGEATIPGGAGLQRALDEAEVFLREAWESGAWEETEPDRVLATVMSRTSSARASAHSRSETAFRRELLGRDHELVYRQLVRFRGKEVDTAGGGFLASFDGPARAIRCAQAVVERVNALGLEVPSGLHTGECELLDERRPRRVAALRGRQRPVEGVGSPAMFLHKDKKIELLKGVPLFSHCNKKQLAAVAQLADLVDLPPDKELITEGEAGHEFLIVVEGTGEVRREGRKIDTIGPGDFIGEMSLLTGAPRNASVKTTSPTTLLAVTDRAFWGLLDQSPDIQRSILKAVAERLHPETV